MTESSDRDPWRRTPVGELSEQLLPRWFVILVVVIVPVAIVVIIAALVLPGRAEQPVAERRPPPRGNLTSDVGQYVVGESDPVPVPGRCPLINGLSVAGSAQDQRVIREALTSLCNADLPLNAEQAVRRLSEAGGVVRFAQFEATGVDSTAILDAKPPVVLVNNRFAFTEPLWIAPLVVHDAVVLAGEPGTAASALEARRAEAAACAILEDQRPSRGCDDAAALLRMDDPLSALREAGFE